MRRVGEDLGKVRPERVKRVARELIKRYPDKFTTNFEDNKKLVGTLIETPSTRLKNRIAGYITSLIVSMQPAQTEEIE
jgi:small subunit ribosomal protein S17e